jgi:hypothetical protein
VVKVSVVAVPAPVGVTVDGEKLQLVPEGNPRQTNEIAEWNPFDGVTAMVALPLCPAFNVSSAKDDETEKSELFGSMV